MRVRSILCAALIVTGIAGPLTSHSAFAAAPTLSKAVPFSGSFDDGGETCGAAFSVNFTYSGTRTYIDFYGADGTLLKEIRQITFTGTLTNEVTGASVPYTGRFIRTYDAATDTITITGLTDKVGGVAVTAGRNVLMLDTAAATEAGKDDFDRVVCAALS